MNILRLIAVAMLGFAMPALASLEMYAPPRAANVDLVLKSSDASGCLFTAKIKALAGSLRNIRLSFKSSLAGVKCEPEVAEQAELPVNKEFAVDFLVKLSARQAADPETMVQCTAEYLPDYQEMKNIIAADKAAYSDDHLRTQLLEIIDQNIASAAHAVDAARWTPVK